MFSLTVCTLYSWQEILEEGFDFRRSSQGRYGIGAYFAVHAQYSDAGGYVSEWNGKRVILVAYVLEGKGYYESQGNNALTAAPEGFDSVTNTVEMTIVYREFQAIPAYVVMYNYAV